MNAAALAAEAPNKDHRFCLPPCFAFVCHTDLPLLPFLDCYFDGQPHPSARPRSFYVRYYPAFHHVFQRRGACEFEKGCGAISGTSCLSNKESGEGGGVRGGSKAPAIFRNGVVKRRKRRKWAFQSCFVIFVCPPFVYRALSLLPYERFLHLTPALLPFSRLTPPFLPSHTSRQ